MKMKYGGAAMSKGDNRLKIFYVLDELRENSRAKSETDESRYLSANCLIDRLNEKYNLTADRKSIYNYIESLSKYGYEIQKSKRGYYLVEHYDGYDEQNKFELPELKLIVDALSASRFISAKKTDSIISKLKCLLPESGTSLENRRVYQEKQIKADNFSVIYSIDAIHSAITSDKKISFHYRHTIIEETGFSKRLVSESKLDDLGTKKVYVQSPFALIWKNEYYYCLCYDSESKIPRTFRVDRMNDVTVLYEGSRDGKDFFKGLSISDYTNTAFSMFSGEKVNVVLRVNNELAGVIADRFGKDIYISDDDDENFFRCSVSVQKSEQFFSWLSGFGRNLELVFPKDIRNEYIDYIRNILNGYLESTEN